MKLLKMVAAFAAAFSGANIAAHATRGKPADEPKDKGGESTASFDASKAEPLRKITVAVVCGKLDAAFFEKLVEVKRMDLMRVWGEAKLMKPGESDYGPYVRFVGMFRAMNLQTGEVYKAPVVLLPKFLEEELAGALAGEGAKAVAFGFQIGVKLDLTAATKYTYFAEPLVGTETSDVLGKLDALVMAKPLPQLSAPK